MTTDNKTLADVQPGGRVRLGDQAERARFEAWARKHGLSSRTLREAYEEAQQAALSAQPSPGATALGLPIVVDPTMPPDTFEVRQPSPGVAVPAGWKLVPIEPTWSMRNEGRELLIDGIEKEPERLAYFLWKTMINAAPEVP